MDRVVGLVSGFFAQCRGLERVASTPHAADLLLPRLLLRLLLRGRLRTPTSVGLLVLLPQRPAHQPVVQAGKLVIPLGHAGAELLQKRAHLARGRVSVRVRVRVRAGGRARVRMGLWLGLVLGLELGLVPTPRAR